MRCAWPARSPVSGWFLGLLTLRGRPRLLVVVGVAGFAFYLAGSLTYLLVLKCCVATADSDLPRAVPNSALMTGAPAGFWGALKSGALGVGITRTSCANTPTGALTPVFSRAAGRRDGTPLVALPQHFSMSIARFPGASPARRTHECRSGFPAVSPCQTCSVMGFC